MKVIENSYKVLNEKMKVIAEPELDIESIRQSVEGIFDDWDGTKWPKGLMQNIRDLN